MAPPVLVVESGNAAGPVSQRRRRPPDIPHSAVRIHIVPPDTRRPVEWKILPGPYPPEL